MTKNGKLNVYMYMYIEIHAYMYIIIIIHNCSVASRSGCLAALILAFTCKCSNQNHLQHLYMYTRTYKSIYTKCTF